MIASLDRVRAAVKVPVTTAEQWHVYREHPELAQHVDLIAAHVPPYWEATPVAARWTSCSNTRARTQGRLRGEAAAAPGRLAEQRAHARQRRGDTADQAIYLRRLTNALNGEGYSYFVIEAFDQP